MKRLITILLLLIFSSCGSGGGDSSSDTGSLVLRVSPNKIKVGTISFVTVIFNSVNFDDLDNEGISIKFLLPEELEFIKGSAVLVLRNGAIQIDPVFNGSVGDVDDDNELEQIASAGSKFLVFSITGETLDKETTGSIEFNVRGVEPELRTRVSVDLDKGAVSSFDVTNPGFDAEAMTEVDVIEED